MVGEKEEGKSEFVGGLPKSVREEILCGGQILGKWALSPASHCRFSTATGPSQASTTLRDLAQWLP